jgi:RNA-directed DNA polymerase
MSKKHDHLIERIADWDNLLLAYQKARSGKRDRAEVQVFAGDLWLHLGNIQHHLLHGTYRMGTYRRFVVYEPKRREILAAPFADRVMQHAILNVLQPIWDACMIEDTYACRPGKGTHAGADRLQQWLRDMTAND